MKEKRRPTLDELRLFPADLWRLEVAQIAVDAREAGCEDIWFEGINLLIDDPDLTPEKVVALREKLTAAIDVQPVATITMTA